MRHLLIISIIILCFEKYHFMVSHSSFDFCNIENDPVFWNPTQNCRKNETYNDIYQLQRYDNTEFAIFTKIHDAVHGYGNQCQMKLITNVYEESLFGKKK